MAPTPSDSRRSPCSQRASAERHAEPDRVSISGDTTQSCAPVGAPLWVPSPEIDRFSRRSGRRSYSLNKLRIFGASGAKAPDLSIEIARLSGPARFEKSLVRSRRLARRSRPYPADLSSASTPHTARDRPIHPCSFLRAGPIGRCPGRARAGIAADRLHLPGSRIACGGCQHENRVTLGGGGKAPEFGWFLQALSA